MKRMICALMIVFLFVMSIPAYAAQYAQVVTPTEDGTVYVRSVAGAGRPILGVAKNGDVLEIVKKGNTWHKVKVVRTGLTGYMYGAYIDFTYQNTGSGSNWGSSSGADWGTTGSYTPDASVRDKDKVYNCDARVSSSDGYANLRWGPGMDYGIIGRVSSGATVWALEQNGDWYRCDVGDGRIGYINKGLLKLGNTSTASYGENGVVRSSDGFAAVRAGAGTNYTQLYTMNVGQSTSVYGTSGQWLRVSRENSWGEAFVHRTLLRFQWNAVTTGNVNLRKGPGTSYGKLGVLSTGTNVKLLATDGRFARVDTGSAIAFVSNNYLRY